MMPRKESQRQLKKMYSNLEKFVKNATATDTSGRYKTKTKDGRSRSKQRQADILGDRNGA